MGVKLYTIELCNHLFFCSITHKKGLRNIHYHLEDNTIIITCPYGILNSEIIRILKNDEQRVYKLLMKHSKPLFELKENDTLKLLGKEYLVVKGTKNLIIDNVIYLKEIELSSFLKLTSKLLLNYVTSKQDYYYSLMYKDNKNPIIKIKKVKTYYGQYNKKYNQITYNINLLFSDVECIDYVIVHELSHIAYMSHDQRFYSKVESIMPNYKYLRQKLKKESIKLC